MNFLTKSFRFNPSGLMNFGEPSPDVIARLYNEIKEKKV